MSQKNTVVLFDVENIAETDDLKKILGLVYESILGDVSPYMSIAYADWSRQSLGEKRLRSMIEEVSNGGIIRWNCL